MSWLIISLHVLTLLSCFGLLSWEVRKAWLAKRAKKVKKETKKAHKISYRNLSGEIVTLTASGVIYVEGGQSPMGYLKAYELRGSQDDLDDFLDAFSDLEGKKDILVSSSNGKRVVIQQPQLALVDAWNDLATGSMMLKNLHMVFFSEIVTPIDENFEVPL